MADRRIPRPLREPVFRAYARATGADLAEVRGPLDGYASLGAFFVRRLVAGARPIPADESLLPSPVDGTVQAIGAVEDGTMLQAKGRPYAVEELLGAAPEIPLEGGTAWTLYLAPRDYHRVHAPLDGELLHATWLAGGRHSVAPAVLDRRPRVLSTNERCVLRLSSAAGPYYLVLVGALNVGRIRVVGVEPGHRGELLVPRPLRRGEELARFEMGSTVVLLQPPGCWTPVEGIAVGDPVRLGTVLARRTQ